jgi:hypothetical protein
MFLHGTSDAVLDAIMAQGLVPRGDKPGVYGRSVGAPQGRSRAVYLTTQEGMARFAAREAAKFLGGKPIIVVVQGISERSLAPDEDSGQATARASVERIGSVAHNGRISPEHIVEIREVDPIGQPHTAVASGAAEQDYTMRRNQSAKTKDVTQTAAFRRWSKGAPVIPQGAPLPEHGPFVVRAFHGSFADIEAFWTDGPEAPEDDEGEHRIEAGDPNVYWGAHFALEPHVADKFAGVGGDVRWLKMRQGAGSVYPVYLRLENPARMPEEEMWVLSYSQHLSGNAAEEVAAHFENLAYDQGDLDEALDNYFKRYDADDYFRAEVNQAVVEGIKKFLDDPSYAEEILADLGSRAKSALQAAGYDSVIYQNVVEGGTSVIVFSPTQIKSATGNRGTYDPEDPDIRHNPRRRRNGTPALMLDNLAGPITLGEGRCRVHFDNTGGSGAVPDVENIEYMGAVVLMRPSMFLRLVPPLLQPSKRALEHLAQTRSTTGWAYPFLSIDPEEPRVRQHEGRHRCTLLVEAGCDEPIPVALFLSGMRARHIEPEDIERLRRGMVGQHRSFVSGPLFGEALWAGNQEGAETSEIRENGPGDGNLDWRRPETWPSEVSFKGFSGDFKVLLRDHGMDLDSYPLLQIDISDVYIPPIEDEVDLDERDMDEETGEFSPEYVQELAKSMAEGRLMPPIVVGDVTAKDQETLGALWGWPYDGRHRLHAARMLGIRTIPAIDVSGLFEE